MPGTKNQIPVARRLSVNLKRLVEKSRSVTFVAQHLGISRAQFNRYLSGEAYPKPPVLKVICDYFGVDARILTDVLSEAYLTTLPEPGTMTPPVQLNPGLENAVNYLPANASKYVPQSELPDGLYLYWRMSTMRDEQIICSALRVSTLPGARVVRTYVLRDRTLMTTNISARDREMRGLIIGVKDGYAWLFLHSPVWNNISMVFTAVPEHSFSPLMPGYYALARDEYAGARRLGRGVIERLPPKCSSVVKAAHAVGFHDFKDVPSHIRQELTRPLA